jgi:hypothetical protein
VILHTNPNSYRLLIGLKDLLGFVIDLDFPLRVNCDVLDDLLNIILQALWLVVLTVQDLIEQLREILGNDILVHDLLLDVLEARVNLFLQLFDLP